MNGNDETGAGVLRSALDERLEILTSGLDRERELYESASAERAERVKWWEELVTETRQNSMVRQLGSYKSMARSMSALLGASVAEQAKVMIPFEIAEATKDFANFLSSKDPAALAASLQHVLAAKQYAAAAKSGAGGAGGGHGGGGRREEAAKPEERRPTRVIVNVGRGVGVIDTYEFARGLIGAINENLSDDVVLEVAS